jgi:hypothetical protein
MYPHVKQFETRRQEVARRLEHILHTTPNRHPRRRAERAGLPRVFARVAAYASGR